MDLADHVEECRRACARVRERSTGPDTYRHLAELLAQSIVYLSQLDAEAAGARASIDTLREQHRNDVERHRIEREQLTRKALTAERDGDLALAARELIREQRDEARAALRQIADRKWWQCLGWRAVAREGLRESHGG